VVAKRDSGVHGAAKVGVKVFWRTVDRRESPVSIHITRFHTAVPPFTLIVLSVNDSLFTHPAHKLSSAPRPSSRGARL